MCEFSNSVGNQRFFLSDLGRGFQWKFRNLDLDEYGSGDFIKANLNYKVIKITDNDNVILVEEVIMKLQILKKQKMKTTVPRSL
ncbi:unnamed protein product [Rhizophagus irregularis]|nr:unnamed protein product [Rhizophagus irregularis]CAB5296949.1 unnamed protein product [Rhizophagus irregularis]